MSDNNKKYNKQTNINMKRRLINRDSQNISQNNQNNTIDFFNFNIKNNNNIIYTVNNETINLNSNFLYTLLQMVIEHQLTDTPLNKDITEI